MKLAIVGGRDFKDKILMARWVALIMTANIVEVKDKLIKYDVKIISGGARGADSLGEMFAKIYGCCMAIYKPDWKKHGKAAGFIRNQQIVDNCEIVLAFWDGKSNGTRDTINKAKKAKKPTFIVYY